MRNDDLDSLRDDKQPVVEQRPGPLGGSTALPKKSWVHKKKWWIAVLAVVLLAALSILLKLATSPVSNPVSDSSTTTTSASKPKAMPAGWAQVPCDDSDFGCVPNVTIDHDVLAPLQKLGFSCSSDTSRGILQECKETKGGAGFDVSFSTPDGNPNSTRVQDVVIHADVAARGQNPPDRTHDAWAANVGNFHTIVDIIFSQYPAVKKDMETWVDKQSGTCPYPTLSNHDLVDGYELRCDPIAPISVSGSLGIVTTWPSNIDLSTPQVP